MRRNLLLLAALALIAGFGVAEGVWTGRWTPSHELEQAAARVAGIPRSLGDWEGVDTEIDAREVAMAKLKGYVRRTYTHRKTGDTVTVMVLCGKSGPIAAHTPDVCFQGQGLSMTAEPATAAVPFGAGEAANFWSARFTRSGLAGTETSLALWSWSSDGQWEAAGRPRVEYARAPFLYKLYVIRPVGNSDQRGVDEPVLKEFLQVFLPAVQASLFRPADAH